MPQDLHRTTETRNGALNELSELRRFSGTPKDFWPRLLAAQAALCDATKAALLLKETANGEWKRIGDWSANVGPSRLLTAFVNRLEEAANRCTQNGACVVLPLEDSTTRPPSHFAVATRLTLLGDPACVAIVLLSEVTEAAARESLVRLQLTSDVARSFQEFQSGQRAQTDITSFAHALDLMAEVNAQTRFLATALAFCNGVASRFGCERVSLGWLQSGYVRLKAISRTEKFNRQMAAAQSLEAAMDECLDQDEELIWPTPEGANVVTRDHERFSREQNTPHLASLPLRVDAKPAAVVLCERARAPFSPVELRQLRLCCDQATRRLADLYRRDRWFGARWAAWWKEKFALLVGPKHTWAKVLSLLAVTLLAALILVRVPYRVEGNFVLKSDEVSFRTAPFDGFIEQVYVRPGDTVKAGAPLLKLATRELELEELSAQAEVVRFQRESEKARSTNGLAEMRIALAAMDQVKARLDLVRHRLSEATLKAPFDGSVVEGDLRERLAAPVKQGDALLKIARLEKLYVEAEVPERDIHDILQRQRGEIAFVSQPKFTFPVRIGQVEPAAFPRQEGNVFLVRCHFERGLESWWRPGMSGLCKFQVEPRTLGWILTHRTVDFLRLKLWWP